MNQRATRHYKRLREKNWHAREACRAAKAKEAFEVLEGAGLARLRVESDDMDPRDLMPECYSEKEQKEFLERAERLGVYGIIIEARNPLSGDAGPWEGIDSCWGFIGDDWADSGYDTDFYLAAIDWLSQFEGMPS